MITPDLGFIHRFEPSGSISTLLLLHGTGADENDLIPLGRAVAPGWSLLSPPSLTPDLAGRRSMRGMLRGTAAPLGGRVCSRPLGRVVAWSTDGWAGPA
jgi:hypothetical protein